MNPVDTLETSKAVNTVKQLQTLGQSIWLDYIRRDLLTGGELKRLIDEDGLRGMTSNPVDFRERPSPAARFIRIFSTRSPSAPTSTPRAATNCSRFATFKTAADLLTPGVPQHEAARRIREPGSLSVSRQRHRGHYRRSAAACGRPWPART